MNQREVNKRLEMYSVISKISALFASMDTNDADKTITEALGLVGRFLHTDRVYIFKYDFINQICCNSHEWCENGIIPVIDTLKAVPLDLIPHWVKQHTENETLYINDVKALAENDAVRQIIEPQGIQSLMTIPMIYNRVLKGFLGIDSVKTTRTYSDFEQKVLFELSIILASVFQRLESEEKRKKEKITTEYLLEASKIAAWEWDIPTKKIKINERWANIIGYTLSELEPTTIDTWIKFTHPDDYPLAEAMLNEAFQNKGVNYDIDFRMIHKDGHYVWVRDSGKVIEWKNNQPIKMVGTHIDITKLKDKEDKLRSVTYAVDQSPAAVLITDVDGNIQYVNKHFSDITGYSADEVLGKNPRFLRSDYHNSDFYNTLWKRIKSGKTWTGEFKNTKKNGELYWESAVISPVHNERNEIVKYVAIKRDVSEEKKQEIERNDYQKHLEEDLSLRMKELEESQRASVFALARLTESRDSDTGHHVERVQHLCKALATALKANPELNAAITPEFINNIFYSSALHDIGKISIPDKILLKPGKLTEQEFEAIQQHVKFGADNLSEMIRLFPNNDIILMAAKIARYHHEKWDGTGYLSGLKENEIPLPARIMAIVDVYDALRSKRPYKGALSHFETMKIIRAGSGNHFDPKIVDAFEKINEQIEIIFDSMA